MSAGWKLRKLVFTGKKTNIFILAEHLFKKGQSKFQIDSKKKKSKFKLVAKWWEKRTKSP